MVVSNISWLNLNTSGMSPLNLNFFCQCIIFCIRKSNPYNFICLAVCPAGSFGSYSHNGNQQCHSCPPFSTSLYGSRRAENCQCLPGYTAPYGHHCKGTLWHNSVDIIANVYYGTARWTSLQRYVMAQLSRHHCKGILWYSSVDLLATVCYVTAQWTPLQRYVMAQICGHHCKCILLYRSVDIIAKVCYCTDLWTSLQRYVIAQLCGHHCKCMLLHSSVDFIANVCNCTFCWTSFLKYIMAKICYGTALYTPL